MKETSMSQRFSQIRAIISPLTIIFAVSRHDILNLFQMRSHITFWLIAIKREASPKVLKLKFFYVYWLDQIDCIGIARTIIFDGGIYESLYVLNNDDQPME